MQMPHPTSNTQPRVGSSPQKEKEEMSDDIVTWLRRVAPLAKAQDPDSPDPYWWSLTAGVTAAADEIERLRKAAYALIDELRYNGGYEAYTSKMVFAEFYEQAVRGE